MAKLGGRHVHSGTPERSDVVGGADYRNDASATDPNVADEPNVHGQDKALAPPEMSPFADVTVEKFRKRGKVKASEQKMATPANKADDAKKDEPTPSDARKDELPKDLDGGFGKASTFPSVKK